MNLIYLKDLLEEVDVDETLDVEGGCWFNCNCPPGKLPFPSLVIGC